MITNVIDLCVLFIVTSLLGRGNGRTEGSKSKWIGSKANLIIRHKFDPSLEITRGHRKLIATSRSKVKIEGGDLIHVHEEKIRTMRENIAKKC